MHEDTEMLPFLQKVCKLSYFKNDYNFYLWSFKILRICHIKFHKGLQFKKKKRVSKILSVLKQTQKNKPKF